MQWGADESTLDRKIHVWTLRGNAFIYRNGETLKADLIRYNTETDFAHAEGRVEYQYTEYFLRADSVDVDLDKKTGTIINGNISNGRFALRGSRIDQVEPNHFLVKNYDYTTCSDCPGSWEITGSDVDMVIEGYAYIQNFAFKVRDEPMVWLPYMIIPIKSKRQTGFLFPRFGDTSDYGYYVVEPFFWATNRSSDMTFGVGDYTNPIRGARFEWEGRYALSPRSLGIANAYLTHDTEIDPLNYRWAIKTAITQELPLGFEGKLHLNEVSDSGYPIRYSDDILGRQEPVLISDLFFSRNDPDFSTTLSFRRIRNLLRYNGAEPVAPFDPVTVQEFPRLTLSTNDRFIFGQKVAAGVEMRFNRFARAAGPFDTFVSAGSTPTINNPISNLTPTPITTQIVREANRLTLIPNAYTTLHPWPWLSLVPSAQYRSFFYDFGNVTAYVPGNTPGSLVATNYPNLESGYLLGQMEASIQLEKSYSTADPDLSYKNTIRPVLTYSNIPGFGQFQSNSGHPFLAQVNNQYPGEYFDNSDIVPITTTHDLNNYIVPLGNSLTYGLTTQVFARRQHKDANVTVDRRFEAGFSQTLDIYQAKRAVTTHASDAVVLSPFFSHFLYQNRGFSSYTEYTYYSYLSAYQGGASNSTSVDSSQLMSHPSPHRFTTSLIWTMNHQVKQNVLVFDRSVSFGYSFAQLTAPISSLQVSSNFSINDYIMPKGLLSYNLAPYAVPGLLEVRGSVVVQNPSKCWQIEVGLDHSIDTGSSVIFSLALNIAGDASMGTNATK